MDEQREKDIQDLCRQVLANFAKFEYYSNSYDRNVCVFCYQELHDSEPVENIEHTSDCAVLIAKDLSTGL